MQSFELLLESASRRKGPEMLASKSEKVDKWLEDNTSSIFLSHDTFQNSIGRWKKTSWDQSFESFLSL